MASELTLEVGRLFEAEIGRLPERLMNNARSGMDAGMKNIARLAQAERSAPWNKPGVYGKGSRAWRATGYAERSIQGYAVGKSTPADLGAEVDDFGRIHDSNWKAVAPIPWEMANDHTVVGVLTMTAAYAPELSSSRGTDPNLQRDSWGRGTAFGAQHYEGSAGTNNITVHGVLHHLDEVIKAIEAHLTREMAAR